MTQLDKVQLAVRNCITDISNGSSWSRQLAASVTTGALSFFPVGSFGYAVASTFSELSVNSRTEQEGAAICSFRANFPEVDLATGRIFES